MFVQVNLSSDFPAARVCYLSSFKCLILNDNVGVISNSPNLLSRERAFRYNLYNVQIRPLNNSRNVSRQLIKIYVARMYIWIVSFPAHNTAIVVKIQKGRKLSGKARIMITH